MTKQGLFDGIAVSQGIPYNNLEKQSALETTQQSV